MKPENISIAFDSPMGVVRYDEPTYYHMNFIAVHPSSGSQAVAIATNGKTAVVKLIDIKEDIQQTEYVPGELVGDMKADDGVVDRVGDKWRAKVRTEEHGNLIKESAAFPDDAKFPPIKSVVPPSFSEKYICLDAELLAKTQEALGASCVYIGVGDDPLKAMPIVGVNDNEKCGIAVLMPVTNGTVGLAKAAEFYAGLAAKIPSTRPTDVYPAPKTEPSEVVA